MAGKRLTKKAIKQCNMDIKFILKHRKSIYPSIVAFAESVQSHVERKGEPSEKQVEAIHKTRESVERYIQSKKSPSSSFRLRPNFGFGGMFDLSADIPNGGGYHGEEMIQDYFYS